MNKVGATLKGLGSLAAVWAIYVNHTFGPLFWALLALAAVDILLNVHQEEKQLAKFGSAFASIGGVTVLEGHITDPAVVKVAVGVAVIAYIQVVAPQLLRVVQRLPWPASQKAAAITLLEAEVARLQTQAARVAQLPIPVASAPVVQPAPEPAATRAEASKSPVIATAVPDPSLSSPPIPRIPPAGTV